MVNWIDKVKDKKINRRSFLMAGAAGTAALALAGCGNSLSDTDNKMIDESQGKWVPVACWHNCGGRCLNKALVVDGIVIRQKTDDTHEDSPDYPQQRGCLRGRSQRHQNYGVDRLKWPMKRKNWEPGGGKKELRGKDEWEKISWDDALNYIVEELKKVYRDYGPRSVLCSGKGSSEIRKLLSLLGGYSNFWDSCSNGSYMFDCSKYGLNAYDSSSTSDFYNFQKSETIIMNSTNPVWSSTGNPMYRARQMKKNGTQFIYVGPEYNFSAAALDARWIRVRPGTDTAFLLAVAYVMLEEDDPVNNPIIDWDFLNKYTLGFDKDHMPSDACSDESLFDYVVGNIDGIKKTPQWATEITGTPVEDIIFLARELRKDKRVSFVHGAAASRCNGAENLPQIFLAVGCMGGHLGKPGHHCGYIDGASMFNTGPGLIGGGRGGLPSFANPIDEYIAAPVAWKSILEGKYKYTGNGYYGSHQFLPGEIRDIDIRMIYYEFSADLQTIMNIPDGIKVQRKVDFIVANSHFLTPTAAYADIVLPVATGWEKDGVVAAGREILLVYRQVKPPIFEAKPDRWVTAELAKRMGFDLQQIYPIDDKQEFYNILAGSWVLNEDGVTRDTLLTITEADIAALGAKGNPQTGKIGVNEFIERGSYQVRRSVGDNYGAPLVYGSYIQDPEANPRPSPSGKFEFYSQWKGDTLNAMCYAGAEQYKPYPTYIKPLEGYEETYADWNNKVKGDYPFQAVQPHYLRRSHTVFDNIKQLQEAFHNPVYINAQDAAAKDVKDGDIVLISSRYGKTVRQACLLETIMPGVVSIPHGSWEDYDEETGIDYAGSDNVLLGPVAQGMAVSGYNTLNINFEKYTGKRAFVNDIDKPYRMPNIVNLTAADKEV